MAERYIGFRFVLKDSIGGDAWGVSLQGNGGLYGDGVIAALNSEDTKLDPVRVAERLLVEAQNEHMRTGYVRRVFPTKAPHQRIVRTRARPVRCYAIKDPEFAFKACVCGTSYSRAQWDALPSKGVEVYCGTPEDGGDVVLDFRDCSCGSTLCVDVSRQISPEEIRELRNAQRMRDALRNRAKSRSCGQGDIR